MSKRPSPPPEGQLITAARERIKLSVREAARRAGISDGWWRQIVLGYQSLSGGGYGRVSGPAETVARMAHVVGVTPEQLEDAGRPDAAAELRDLIFGATQVEPVTAHERETALLQEIRERVEELVRLRDQRDDDTTRRDKDVG